MIYFQHHNSRWAERVRSTFGLEATSEGATLGVKNSAACILSRQKIIWEPYSVISDISLILYFLSKDYLKAIIWKCYLRAIFCNILVHQVAKWEQLQQCQLVSHWRVGAIWKYANIWWSDQTFGHGICFLVAWCFQTTTRKFMYFLSKLRTFCVVSFTDKKKSFSLHWFNPISYDLRTFVAN